MAVNLTNADQALKSYYLDVVASKLNKMAHPFLAKIKQSTADVYGKEVRKLCMYGINGGIGAGTEDGSLPKASGNNYKQLVAPLKNLYGTIEISDKAVRASENNAGAFVDLLNAEMEGLVKSSSFNLSRMLFGNSQGVVAKTSGAVASNGDITVDSVKNIEVGMTVDLRLASTPNTIAKSGVITSIDKATKKIKLNTLTSADSAIVSGTLITIQGSYEQEITGLAKICAEEGTLYGVDLATNGWMKAFRRANVGAISENVIQTAIDNIEENSGSKVNFIVCSWGVKRALQNALSENKRYIDTTVLEGGATAITFNGIPVVADRFCPEGTMYLLNTEDFTMCELCDWEWLSSEDGRILKQIPNKPVYTATLVKYAELVCDRPYGQGVLTGITEA